MSKIPCGGFNLNESLFVDKKKELGTVIGGGLSPLYDYGFNGNEVSFSKQITSQVTTLNLPTIFSLKEQGYDPKHMLLYNTIEYEIEYGGLKTTDYYEKAIKYNDTWTKVYSLGISGNKFQDFIDDGKLPDEYDFPFALLQVSNSSTCLFMVLNPNLLDGDSVLTIRKRFRFIEQIGNSFSNSQRLLFYYDEDSGFYNANIGSTRSSLYDLLEALNTRRGEGLDSVQIPDCFLTVDYGGDEEDNCKILTCSKREYFSAGIYFYFYDYNDKGIIENIYEAQLRYDGLIIEKNAVSGGGGGGPV